MTASGSPGRVGVGAPAASISRPTRRYASPRTSARPGAPVGRRCVEHGRRERRARAQDERELERCAACRRRRHSRSCRPVSSASSPAAGRRVDRRPRLTPAVGLDGRLGQIVRPRGRRRGVVAIGTGTVLRCRASDRRDRRRPARRGSSVRGRPPAPRPDGGRRTSSSATAVGRPAPAARPGTRHPGEHRVDRAAAASMRLRGEAPGLAWVGRAPRPPRPRRRAPGPGPRRHRAPRGRLAGAGDVAGPPARLGQVDEPVRRRARRLPASVSSSARASASEPRRRCSRRQDEVRIARSRPARRRTRARQAWQPQVRARGRAVARPARPRRAAGLIADELAGDPLDVVGGDGLDRGERLVERQHPVVERLLAADPRGDVAGLVHAQLEAARQVALRLLELVGRDQLVAQARELDEDRAERLAQPAGIDPGRDLACAPASA